MSAPLRLGILGGTFDPIHLGHLDAADAARDALALDRVVLLPSRIPPHRPRPATSEYHRFAMAAVAALGRERCIVSDLELQAAGPSYSAVTLARLHARGFCPSQLFFIAGADAFAEIATWHDYPAVLDACHFVVIARPGYPPHDLPAQLPQLAQRFVAGPPAAIAGDEDRRAPTRIFLVHASTTDVSATEVRRRLAEDLPLTGLLPDDVVSYARRHRLYSSSRSPADLLHVQD